MKLITFLFFFFASLSVFSQQVINKGSFVRIYDSENSKIYKGRILALSDSTITLEHKKEPITLVYQDIHRIRTKRSAGHNIGVSAAAGGAILGIALLIDFQEGDWFSPGFNFFGGAILGGAFGAGLGAFSALFKSPLEYPINGNQSKWLEFKSDMDSEIDKKKMSQMTTLVN